MLNADTLARSTLPSASLKNLMPANSSTLRACAFASRAAAPSAALPTVHELNLDASPRVSAWDTLPIAPPPSICTESIPTSATPPRADRGSKFPFSSVNTLS